MSIKTIIFTSLLLTPLASLGTTYSIEVCNNTSSSISTTVKSSTTISHDVRTDFGYDGSYVTIAANTCKKKSYDSRLSLETPNIELCVKDQGCINANLPIDGNSQNPVGQDGGIVSNSFKSPNTAAMCCPTTGEGNNYNHGIKIDINPAS